MIRNKFSILLAERSIKITRVAKDTGISRSTLNNISKNDTDMIRLETINTLCKYLGVTHCEFFEYEPLDINFYVEVLSMPFAFEENNDRRVLKFGNIEIDLIMDIDWGHEKKSIDLSCDLETDFTITENRNAADISAADKNINFKIGFDKHEEKEYFVNKIYSEIDGSFYKDIYNSLCSDMKVGIDKVLGENIDCFIKEHIDTKREYNSNEENFRDDFFIDDLDFFKNNVNILINSDVFKPF